MERIPKKELERRRLLILKNKVKRIMKAGSHYMSGRGITIPPAWIPKPMSKQTLRSIKKILCPACGFQLRSKVYVIRKVDVTWNFMSSSYPSHTYPRSITIKPQVQMYNVKVKPTGKMAVYDMPNGNVVDHFRKDEYDIECPRCNHIFDKKTKLEILDAINTLTFVKDLAKTNE